MIKYAITDQNGLVIGHGTAENFLSALNSSLDLGTPVLVPDSVIVRPGMQYVAGDEFFDTGPCPDDAFEWNGSEWIDLRTPEEKRQAFLLAKDAAIVTINSAIGKIRSRFVTVIPAQDMLYQAKEAEAKEYLSDPAPIETDYPFIHAEIGITGDDAWQVAQVYVNQSLILRQTAAQLETVRLGHIAMVEAATHVEAVEVALSSFNQVLETL